ncbi:spermidine synthase [Flavobacterium sp. F372]|uniref:Fused MFS/spermidine synthase n=2 Tax=Flavobacterium bernardetii TaxID=2813823 RepID=A0ABR7IWX1_9FLAO|nr:fused MFS/spermidine synthase [Flavobacterium bernardetii]MBC5834032.1 fused MFS/spermidine synthase [Flavobacterium bernardetii]NHF69264.1 spermidine synthase [Flavobacterium bernardetii]
MFKKILSYFYPITVYNKSSNISKSIEVTLYNGKTLLNTKNTNYSYGSLQSVLKKGLLTIGQSEISKMNSVLVLGVAGGSVVKTLITDFEFTKSITGVELDPEIIEIANSYFDLDKVTNFKCIIDDAEQFVATSTDKFDLIIIDIFKDTEMPEFLFEERFINSIKQRLNINGYIIFNMMILDASKKYKIQNYLNHFEGENYSKNVLKNVERYNDLIIIKSL